MRNFYLLLFSLCATSVFAQINMAKRLPVAKNQPLAVYRPAEYPLETGAPLQDGAPEVYQSGVHYRMLEEPVGTTTWDAQTYGCTPSRIYANAQGQPVVNWLFSKELSGFSDRGTANNTRTGATGWPDADRKIEGVRTGFPAAAILANGTEVVVAHTTSFTPYRLRFVKKAPGATTWANSDLPLPAGQGCLWPQMAVGGPDGNTIHVIAITTPVANTGTVYQEVNGHLLYWRSTDGGNTWDIKHAIIPGADSTLSAQNGANNYTIDANGNNVAVAIFNSISWQDIPVFKSVNNGSSWSTIMMRDFPDKLENYTALPGAGLYTQDDIGPVDSLAPVPLSIMTNDGHGSLLIDNSGQVHAWFGATYVIDNTDNDSTWFYYPLTNQLRYWKESFGTNNFVWLTGALDYDGDGQLGIASSEEIAPYSNAAIVSMPQAGMDAKGRIFLVYTAIHELYRTGTLDDDDEFYRHIYLMRSDDGGDSWGQPLEITNVPYIEDFFIPTAECVTPTIPRRIGDKIWISYQQDQIPGSNVAGNHHIATTNSMMWVEVDPDSISVSIRLPENSTLDFSIAPNPVQSILQISVESEDDAPVQTRIFDITGKLVQEMRLSANKGRQVLYLPVHKILPGTYYLQIQQGQRTGFRKVIKLQE
jgi:hypothetical protein